MSSRFMYQGKVYTAATLDQLTLDDLIVFEDETAETGRPMTMVDAEKLNPESGMSIAIGIWATLRSAGDMITFADARKIRLGDLKELPATGDRQSPKARAPRKSKATSTNGIQPVSETLPAEPVPTISGAN